MAILGVLAFVIHRFGWSYMKQRSPWRSRRRSLRQSRRDWLALLIVPFALAAFTVVFSLLQSDREQKREDARANREQRREDALANREARIAAEARRDQALSDYLERMSALRLQHRLGSRLSDDDAVVARGLTLAALRRLDGRRKGQVLQYLYDAGLLDGTINLRNADFRYVSLRNVLLESESADSWLIGADLRRADFRGSYLSFFHFRRADLRAADFSDAVIYSSYFKYACLSDARFRNTTLQEDNFAEAIGHDIDFSHADLWSTTAERASLSELKLDGIAEAGSTRLERAIPRLSRREQDEWCNGPRIIVPGGSATENRN